MKNERESKQESRWEEGWQGHEKAQLMRMARLSFEQKLQWLEEAQEMAQGMKRAPTLTPGDSEP